MPQSCQGSRIYRLHGGCPQLSTQTEQTGVLAFCTPCQVYLRCTLPKENAHLINLFQICFMSSLNPQFICPQFTPGKQEISHTAKLESETTLENALVVLEKF